MPTKEVTVGQLRRWLSAFDEGAYVTLATDGGYTAPKMELVRGVRSIVTGHFDAREDGGLFFVALRRADS